MKRRQGLTLVELLVSIAIVVVLAGLLFVSGRWALVTARTASCTSNLRQGAKALGLYAADHDDFYPPYFLLGLPVGVPDVVREGEVAFVNAIGRYGWSEEVRFCPLDRFARTDTRCEMTTTHLHTSYQLGLDVYLLGAVNRSGNAWRFSPSMVEDPARTPLLHSKSRVEPDPNEVGGEVRLTAHGEWTNAVYLDGHAKLVRHTDPDD